MNKTANYILIGVGVLCLAYPGFAWLIGVEVQSSMLEREQQVLEQYPGTITLISRQYQRGLYGATEDLTYGIGANTLRALQPVVGGPDVAGLRVTVRNTIHHGPLPQFRSFAMATMTTQVELPAQVSAKIQELLGGEPTLQIHSRLGWLGRLTTVIASPGYQARLPDGTELSWQGLKATSGSNASLSANSLDATLASFKVKSTKVQVDMSELQLNADMKRAFGSLYTGLFSLKIGSLKWQSQTSTSQGLLQGLSIGGAGSADGDYYKSAVDFAADTVHTPTFTATHADYAISFEHLYGPTIAALMKAQQQSAMNTGSGPQPAPQAALDAMRKNGIELLLHDPVLNISHIGFTMPEGELRLSATASAPGIKREELEDSQFMPALMQHLNVAADLRIDATLLTHLLASSGRQDALSAQIDDFEKQGYIKRDGAALTAHVTFVAGKIAINGLPYPPGAPR